MLPEIAACTRIAFSKLPSSQYLKDAYVPSLPVLPPVFQPLLQMQGDPGWLPDQCCSRKCKTKRLCHDLHRRSCSDKRTCTAARAGIAFRPVKFYLINLAALKLCTVHSELLQSQHFRTRIHGSTRNKHGRNIDSGKSDQISRHSFVAAGKIDTGIKRSRICMNLDHICNHFTAGQAVIDSVCSLAFAVTYIGAVVACTKSAFLCNSFPYLFLQDIQVAAAG
mgnify:CR=1 FL=1